MRRKSKSPVLITQDLLANLREVRRAKAELLGREQRLRSRVLTLIDAGAPTEPGPLRVRVKRKTRVFFTQAGLTELLGIDEVTWLRNELPPTEVTTVHIEERFDEARDLFSTGNPSRRS